jgi:protoheme IX farnesyltransferase
MIAGVEHPVVDTATTAAPLAGRADPLAASRGRMAAWMQDVALLVRPRIAVMVLATVAAAAWLTCGSDIEVLPLAGLLVGTALVAASSSIVNQMLEHRTDRRMQRTRSRPIAAGRLGMAGAGWWSAGLLVAGSVLAVAAAGWQAAIAAVVTWCVYVGAYTPLKRITPLNTAVGAVAGALPVAIGWLGADGPHRLAAGDSRAALAVAALATVLYLWQFPHFMAIAWLYRRQYSDAGLQMLTVADPSGLRAAGQSLAAALALVPVSLVLAVPSGSIRMFLTAGLASIVYACGAIWFAINRDDRSARRLLLTSLAVLLVLMAAAIGFGGPTDRSLGP